MESNPFATDIVDSFASDVPESDRLILHADVFDSLEAVLEAMRDREAALRRGGAAGVSAPGQLLLLLAPAAGYGKTYFLARASRALREEFEMVPLRFPKGAPIGWGSVLNDLLEHCFESEAPSGGLRLIDELARRLFADLTAHLIRSGEVPAPNPEEAVRALTDTPLEVFDFSNAEGKVVQWFCGVFEALLPSIAAEAQRRYGLTREASVFWLRALYEHSREVAEKNGACAGRERFAARLEGNEGESVVDRLSGLGRLLCRWRPVIFIADHLDSLFGDRVRGADLGRLLVDLPEIVPSSVTIVSVNRDLWEATFRGSLPSAVEDRLISEALLLGGLSPEEARQLVEQRLVEAGIADDMAARFFPWMESGDGGGFGESGELSPRRLLRVAKERWDAFVASGYDAPVQPGAWKGEDGAAEGLDDRVEGAASKWDPGTPGVDFVSLSGEAPEFKGRGYEPLEPLVFDRHLTLRPKRFKVPRRDEIEDAAKLKEVPSSLSELPRAVEELPSSRSELPRAAEEGIPELAETVENLKAEAQKAFFEFHEIFKAALSPEGEGGGSSDPEVKAIEEATAEIRVEEAAREEVVAAGGNGGLAGDYNQLRRHILTGMGPGSFDLVRFYAVLNGVGDLLPVVVQNEFDLPEHPGFRVLEWSNESQRVFFGLLSVKNSMYWNALIRYASRFIGSESDMASNDRGQLVKVVVFAPEGDALKATHWQNELSDLGGRFPSIDVIEVDRETVAAIYATARMLDEARDSGSAGRRNEVLRFAIRELDFFWRRLTRGVS